MATCRAVAFLLLCSAGLLATTEAQSELQLVVASNNTGLLTGETALLACVFHGPISAPISWTYGGMPVNASDPRIMITQETEMIAGLTFTKSYLRLCSVELADADMYTCTATNNNDTASSDIQLSVSVFNGLDITVVSGSTTLVVGETTLLACVRYGYGQTTLPAVWSHNGQVVVNSTRVYVFEETRTVSGLEFAVSYLQLCSAEMADSGTYTCSVENSVSLIISSTVEVAVTAVELVTISPPTNPIVGDTTFLACVTYGPTTGQTTWTRDGQPLFNTSLVSIFEANSVQGGLTFKISYLRLCGVTLRQSGLYACTVSNGNDSHVAAIPLSVNTQPLVIAASEDTTVTMGDTVTLACAGYSEPYVEITWILNGASVYYSPLLTNTTEDVTDPIPIRQSFLQICAVNANVSGSYTCIVSNRVMSTEYTIQLTVAYPIVALSPDTTVMPGETAFLFCVGYGDPSVQVSWTRDGMPIMNSSRVSVFNEMIVRSTLTFTRSYLRFCSAEPEDSGDYVCNATSGPITDTSAVTLLAPTAPRVVIISPDSSIPEGDSIILSCAGYSKPNVDITWMHRGQIITNSSLVSTSQEQRVRMDLPFLVSYLQLCSVTLERSGDYTCVVSNGFTTASSTVQLSVYAALVGVSSDTTMLEGETGFLFCIGYGVPTATITWTQNGMAVMESSPNVTVTSEVRVAGARSFTVSTLRFCSADVAYAGTYTCEVNTANVTVTSDVQLDIIPYIAVRLVAVSEPTYVRENDTALLACVTYGETSKQVTWTKNGTIVSDNSSLIDIFEEDANFTLDATATEGDVFRMFFLRICSAQPEDSSSYSCVVSNRDGAISGTTFLLVSTPLELTAISPNTTLEEGETALLTCVGYAEPFVSVTWYRDGMPVMASERIFILQENLLISELNRRYVQSFLRICSAEMADAGNYTCVISNTVDYLNTTRQLTVRPSTHGVGLVLISNDTSPIDGETALLICTGYGDPQAQITWTRSNGVVIGNSSRFSVFEETWMEQGITFKTSYFRVCSAMLQDADVYTCTVTNGQVSESSDVQLLVNLELVGISGDTTVRADESTILSCVGFGHPDIDVTWYRNGAPVSNTTLVRTYSEGYMSQGLSFNITFLQLCSVTMADAGTYLCVVDDGTVTTNRTSQLVVTPGTGGIVQAVITNDTILEEGHTALLSCVAYAPMDLQFNWTRPDGVIEFNSSMVAVYEQDTMISSLRFQQVFLQICSVRPEDSGVYTCTVGYGGFSFSSDIELTITASTAGLDLALISDDTTAAQGETALLVCVATSEPFVEFTWMLRGAEVANSSRIVYIEEDIMESNIRFTASYLQLCSVELSDVGRYTCVVSGQNLTYSASTELSITALDVVAITDDTTVANGESIILSCAAFGVPYAEITWWRNGMVVTNSTDVFTYDETVMEGGRTFKVSFLQLCSVDMATDAGAYECYATNGNAMANASTWLTITPYVPVNLVIISNDSRLEESQTTMLACLAYSYATPAPTVTWMRDGAPVMNTSLITHYEEDTMESGLTFQGAYLEICSIDMSSAGNYTCVVTHGPHRLTETVEIFVRPSTAGVDLGVISNDTTVSELDTVVLVCVGYGEPYAQLNWTRNGQLITNSSTTYIFEEDTVEQTVTFKQSFLQICDVRMDDVGSYTCTLGNGENTEESSVQLTVTESIVQFLGITNDTTMMEGETAVFSCVGYGQHDVQITWWYNGALLTNSSLVYTFQEDLVVEGSAMVTLSTLLVCGGLVANSGAYTCSISNTVTTLNASVWLEVTPATAFLETPQQTDFTADYNTEISFQCRADGFPLPTFTWLKDGTVILAGDKITVTTMTVEGALRPTLSQSVVSTLRIRNVTESDMGAYNCRATNALGSVVLPTPFSLSVNAPPPTDFCTPNPCLNGGQCSSDATTFSCTCQGQFFGTTCNMVAGTPTAPTFTEQPTSVYTVLRSPAVLRCSAVGFPQPTYRWFKDGFPITGETESVLSFDEVAIDDRGSYHCTASNTEGAVMSNAALLSLTNIRQYTVPVFTDLAGFVDPSATIADIRAALPGFVMQLNSRTAGSPITGDDFNAMLFLLGVETTGAAAQVPNTMMFRLELLITLLNSTAVPAGAAVGVNATLTRVVDVATTELQVQNLNIQTSELSRFDGCDFVSDPLTIAGEDRGNLAWTETPIGFLANSECPCSQADISVQASRVCSGNFLDGGTWLSSNTSVCDFGTVGLQLCDAKDIGTVEQITSDIDNLTPEGITIATDIIAPLLMNATNTSADLLDGLLTVIDNVLQAPVEQLQITHEQYNAINGLRDILNQIIEVYPITTDPQEVLRTMFGCSIYSSPDDEGIIFSASLDGDIQFSDVEVPSFNIALPGSLTDAIDQSATPRVLFCAFRNEGLFVQRREYLTSTGMDTLVRVSNIAGAMLPMGVTVSTLSDPVTIIFFKTDTDTQGQAGCYYWDTQLDMGYGGWAQDGCMLVEETSDTVTCECNRLGSYTVLVDTTVQQDNTVGRFTIIGAAVFLVCVIIVLFSILITSDVRGSAYGAILINLCTILILLYCIYIVTHFVGGSEEACRAFAFLVHYFVLAACLALAITSFFTCFTPFSEGSKLKRGQVYLSAILLNWILPLIIVAVSIGVSTDNYFNPDSTPFCRPVNEPYWYGLLLMGGIFLVLGIVFIVLYPFNVKYVHTAQKEKSIYPRYTDYIAIITITVCFYIAWGFGLPATRPLNLGAARIIFEIIFIVFSALLGIAMVVCYVFLSENVRNTCLRKGPGPNSRQVYGLGGAAGANIYMSSGKDDEIPFSDLDANSPPPDYDDLKSGSTTGVPFYYADDESVAEEVGPDDSKEDLGNVFTNMDGVDTLF